MKKKSSKTQNVRKTLLLACIMLCLANQATPFFNKALTPIATHDQPTTRGRIIAQQLTNSFISMNWGVSPNETNFKRIVGTTSPWGVVDSTTNLYNADFILDYPTVNRYWVMIGDSLKLVVVDDPDNSTLEGAGGPATVMDGFLTTSESTLILCYDNNTIVEFNLVGSSMVLGLTKILPALPDQVIKLDTYLGNLNYMAISFGTVNGNIELHDQSDLSSVLTIVPPTGFTQVEALIGISSRANTFVAFYADGSFQFKVRVLETNTGNQSDILNSSYPVKASAEIPEFGGFVTGQDNSGSYLLMFMTVDLYLRFQVTIPSIDGITRMEIAYLNSGFLGILTDRATATVNVYEIKKELCDPACSECHLWQGVSSLGINKNGCLACSDPSLELENYTQSPNASNYQGGDCLISCGAGEYRKADNTCEACPVCCESCGLPFNATNDGYGTFACTGIKDGFNYIVASQSCIELLDLNVINLKKGVSNEILIITFDDSPENIDHSSNLELTQTGNFLGFTTSTSGQTITLTITDSFNMNVDPIKIKIINIMTPVVNSQQKSISNVQYLYYPIENKFVYDNPLKPLIENEMFADTIDFSYKYGPLLTFSHPSLLMIIESVSFIKLFPYMPIQYAPNFQIFLKNFGSDKPVNMYGDTVHTTTQRILSQD